LSRLETARQKDTHRQTDTQADPTGSPFSSNIYEENKNRLRGLDAVMGIESKRIPMEWKLGFRDSLGCGN